MHRGFLMVARDFKLTEVIFVLEQALGCGSLTLDALKVLMRQQRQPSVPSLPLDNNSLGPLQCYDRPRSQVHQYDQLLSHLPGDPS